MKPSPATSGVRIRLSLCLLGLVMLLSQMDRFILSVLAQPIIAELRLSDSQFGLLTGLAFAFFYAVLGVPIAWLADRSDRPRLIAICLGIWTVATALSGLATNFLQMMVARIVVAVGEAGPQPAGHTLIADYLPPDRRASGFAVMSIGGSLGAMAALVLGGLAEEIFGWRMTIAMFGLIGMPIALIMWFGLLEPRRTADAVMSAPAGTVWHTTMSLFRRRTYRRLIGAITLSLLPGYAVAAWAPAFFLRSHALSVGEVGLRLGLITGVATFAGHWLTGYLSDRAHRRGPGSIMVVPMVTMTLMGPLYAVSFLHPSASLALMLFFVPQMLAIMWYAPLFSSLQTTTPPAMRAQAAALALLCSNLLGVGIGPTLTGVVSDMLKPGFGSDSLRYALVIVANLSIFGAIACLLAGRSMRADAQADTA